MTLRRTDYSFRSKCQIVLRRIALRQLFSRQILRISKRLKTPKGQRRQLMLVGVSDDLGDSGKRGNFRRRALRIAAGHDDLGLGIIAVNAADGSTGILIGGGCDGAGIQDDKFSFHSSRGTGKATLLELMLNGSAVGLGGAAAEIFNVKGRNGIHWY